MRIAREEVFGPVLSIIPFDDEEEAVAIANDTLYGLAAGVWTQSIRRALYDAGAAGGRHGVGQHLPRRQLHVAVRRLQALRASAARAGSRRSSEYLQDKSVWIDIAGATPNPFVQR